MSHAHNISLKTNAGVQVQQIMSTFLTVSLMIPENFSELSIPKRKLTKQRLGLMFFSFIPRYMKYPLQQPVKTQVKMFYIYDITPVSIERGGLFRTVYETHFSKEYIYVAEHHRKIQLNRWLSINKSCASIGPTILLF